MAVRRADSMQVYLARRSKISRKALLAHFALAVAFLSIGHDAHGYLWDVYFATPLKGWVAGEDNILSTTDGGRTWKSQKMSGEGQVRIAFRTPEIGWIFGYTRFLQTTDSGETWRTWRPPVPAALGIYFATPKTGWIPTNRKHIFKTNDGGLTWRRQPMGRDDAGGYIVCFSERECVIGGLKGAVLTTSDGGSRWIERQVPADKAFIGQLSVTPDGCAWAIGHIPFTVKLYILRSDDRGQTWKLIDDKTALYPNSVFFWSRNRGLMAGQGIVLTDDGGVTWSRADTPDDTGIVNAVHFVDERLGWAVSDNNVILHTKDGGKTWNRQYWEP